MYSQNTTIHFYYGSSQMLGSEIMFQIRGTESTYLGGGFSGALNQSKGTGETVPGHVNEYEKKFETNTLNEQWCSLYGIGSLGFLGPILVKARLGLSVWNKKQNFLSQNPSTLEPFYYNKQTEVVYEPLVGISFMHSITPDIGVEAGVDNFNKATIGFTVLF